jgi:hypothetical protein
MGRGGVSSSGAKAVGAMARSYGLKGARARVGTYHGKLGYHLTAPSGGGGFGTSMFGSASWLRGQLSGRG